MSGKAGLWGWQWLVRPVAALLLLLGDDDPSQLGRSRLPPCSQFILEGIPAVLVGIIVWFYLPDFPECVAFFFRSLARSRRP